MKSKRILALSLAAALTLGLTACGGKTPDPTQPAAGEGPSGTYTGTATGMGEVKVELTLENGKITAATVDTSHETQGYGLDKGEELAKQLVEAQSADIDGISGCTVTSEAAKTAAAQALSAAGCHRRSHGGKNLWRLCGHCPGGQKRH